MGRRIELLRQAAAAAESRLVLLEARASAMEARMEDMQQLEDEYLSGKYECEALAQSFRDLFIAVHRESDVRQKQVACLDLRLSQRWEHTQLLQQQMERLAGRVEPLLDDALPKPQW